MVLDEATPEDLACLNAEDIEQEALRQERDWYLTCDGFIDFARDSGAAPHAQFQPHGRYAPSILKWNGDPDPEAPDRLIYKYKLVLWPRGAFKTTVFTVGYVCWLIANDPNIRILVASETGKQARQIVGQAMEIIDSEWYRERFGVNRGKKWKEASGEFTSALRKHKHKKEPTLRAAGTGEVWVGSHWDIVIMDDVIGEENSKTITMLETVWEWFSDILAQLDPGCKLLVIGTLWHHADIYCKLQDDPDKMALFERSVHAWRNEDGSLFFPNRLTTVYVGNQKTLMTPRRFSCFYLNQPMSGEQQLYKPEFFRVIEDHEIPSAVWTYIMSDWAFMSEEIKKGRPDRTAFWVISLDCNRVAYVRDFYVGQWKPEESVKLACKLWNDGMQYGWNMKGLCVEKVTHTELLSTVFELVRRETFIHPRIIPITGRSQDVKFDRIETASVRWAQGNIYIARSLRQQFENKFRPMVRELTAWPRSPYDDIADAQSDLDKKDDKHNHRFMCPGPPAGWRSQAMSRHQPAMLDGKFNPDYRYPPRAMTRIGQKQEGQADLWLGKLASTESIVDSSLPADHPVNRTRGHLFQGSPPQSQSIFRRPSKRPGPPGKLW